MATDVSKTVKLILEGVDKNASKVLKGVESSFDGFVSSAQVLSNVGDSFIQVETAILGIGAAALAARDNFTGIEQKISGMTGATGQRLAELQGVAENVFGEGFVDNIDEAVSQVGDLERAFKDLKLAPEELQNAFEKSLAISDLFDIDPQDIQQGVNALVKNIEGMDVGGAFDFITVGLQDDLNMSDDFLDTLKEYGPVFNQAKISAGELYSLLKTGSSEGVLGTDKIADSFKEFQLRVVDVKDETSKYTEALKQLKIDPKSFEALAQADLTEAYKTVIDALNQVDDTQKRIGLGAVLIGTQYEDLGEKVKDIKFDVFPDPEQLKGASDKLLGTFDKLSFNIKGVWNTLILELSKVEAFDDVEAKFGKFFKGLASAMKGLSSELDFKELLDEFDDLSKAVSGLFGDIDFTDADQLKNVVQEIINTAASITDVTGGIAESWKPVFEAIGKAIGYFNDLDESTKENIGNILGFSQQVTLLAGGLGTLVALKSGFGGIVSGIRSITSLGPDLATTAKSMGGLGTAAAVAGSAFVGWEIGSILRENIPVIDDFTQSMFGAIDSILDFSGTQGQANETVEEAQARIRAEVEEFKKLNNITTDTNKNLTDLSEKGEIKVGIDTEGIDTDLNDFFSELDEEKQVKVGLNAQEFQTQLDKGLQEFGFDENGNLESRYVVKPDESSINATKKLIEEKLPTEKELKIKAELDKAKIESETEKFKSSLEFKAKVDVAQIEAATEKFKTLGEIIGKGFESTGDLIGNIFDDFEAFMGKDATSSQIRNLLMEELKKENEYRAQQFEIEKNMADKQIEVWDKWIESREDGDSMIKVNIDSTLEPELKMLAIAVMRHVQVESIRDGFEGLLGI